MKKIYNILILIMVLVSSYIGILYLQSSDIYRALICFAIIPVVWILNIIEKLFNFKISKLSKLLYILFIFFSYFLGSIMKWYGKFYFYDTVIHFISGFVFSLFTLEILIKTKHYDKSVFFNALVILAFSFMIAGCWEYFEFISDKIFNADAQRVLLTGVNDTMKDMIVATIGSLLFNFYYLYFKDNLEKYLKD